jgi:hypothetical protein
MKSITKVAGIALLLAGLGGVLLAQNCIQGLNCPAPTGAPEIDAASAANALVLLGGAVLLIRSRKK